MQHIIPLPLVFFLCLQFFSAQGFDYERAWGTYYGPGGFETQYLMADPQYSLHITGLAHLDPAVPALYYNQYATGGQPVNMAYSSQYMYSQLTNNGHLISAEYSGGHLPSVSSTYGIPVHIDMAGNHYILKYSWPAAIADSGTAGAWWVNDPLVGTNQHFLLIKRDAAGNLLWKTYIPFLLFPSPTSFLSDTGGNLYIIGSTTTQSGMTTPGVFRENYQMAYESNGSLKPNAFVAKLGNQGQLLWGTYLPSLGAHAFTYANQALYIVSGEDLDPALPQLATPSTWQTMPGQSQGLTAINAQTGTRNWGTYLGSPAITEQGTVTSVKANAGGVYLFGISYDFTGNSGYYATPGAHKTQVTGTADYFLAKLSLTGTRVWGTYFGSDGMEFGSPLGFALTDQALFFAGSTFGGGSNIATPGSHLDVPPSNSPQSNNMFFGQFDFNGNLNWASYYGGMNDMIFGQQIGILAPDHNRFYLYGTTRAATGIATEGAIQPHISPNIGQKYSGFIARFDYTGALSTTETQRAASDIVLFDNPNNGNFSLKGKALAQQATQLRIFDASGRMIHHQSLPKQETVTLTLQGQLKPGLYLLHLLGEKQEKLKTLKLMVRE